MRSAYTNTLHNQEVCLQRLGKIGKQPGVHMCSCLQLAHRGLLCRHYFAVLLHDLSVQLDVLSSLVRTKHCSELAGAHWHNIKTYPQPSRCRACWSSAVHDHGRYQSQD